MKNSQILKEEREAIYTKMDAILTAAGDTSLTEEQRTQYNTYKTDAEGITSQIGIVEDSERRAAQHAAAMRAATGATTGTSEEEEKEEIKKRYSVFKAIRHKIDGEPLEGVELEVHMEAKKEARDAGVKLHGMGIASFVRNKNSFIRGENEKRDQNVTTNADGGYTVGENFRELVLPLVPELQLQALGARVMTGLQGNVPIDEMGTGAIAWGTETAQLSETDNTFSQKELSPKRMGAVKTVSKQLFLQSSYDVQSVFIEDLNNLRMSGLDTAGINGSGSGGQPTGILNTSGIGDVAIGTNGGNPTFAHIVDLETTVANLNAIKGRTGYLTTPGVRGLLKQTEKVASTAQFIWMNNMLNGANAVTSTNVPSTLDKGSSTGVCHAIIYSGDWREAMFGIWGRFLDVVIDPYTKSDYGQVRIVVNSYCDFVARRKEAFAAVLDATIT